MRILLVEDERSLSKVLTAILTRNNYSVDAVYDGNEALNYLESGDYDGVILDVMLPGLDGFSVLKTIRGQGIDVPVLMLTARSEVDDKVLGLDSGANDYLTKPFSTRELLARIRAMTRPRTSRTDNVLRMGNVTLNRATFELAAPAGRFRLANKEYQMMELLMSNPGCVVSSERFLDRIWGFENAAESSVVWVYISYLRKKLAALGADVQIRAMRNQGYTLERTGERP